MTARNQLRRVVIAIMGGTVLVAGIAMLVLPGPAVLVIPGGLAILAVEFAWAKRWLRSARAILLRPSQVRSLPKKMTTKSVARSLGFLFRQIQHTLMPKRRSRSIG